MSVAVLSGLYIRVIYISVILPATVLLFPVSVIVGVVDIEKLTRSTEGNYHY